MNIVYDFYTAAKLIGMFGVCWIAVFGLMFVVMRNIEGSSK